VPAVDAPLRGPVVPLVLVARVVSELGALVCIGAAVAGATDGRARWTLAVAAVAATVAVWAAFVAPRAPRRLRDPKRLVLELAVFFCATAGLVALTGSPTAWLALGGAALVALAVRMTGVAA
jgi:hypothetical protein